MTDAFPYQTIRVSCWKDAKAEIERLDPTRWIFRGQADSKWGLESSLERAAGRNCAQLTAGENTLLNDFRRRAPYYLKGEPLPKTKLDWLALMQHHGVPTRLLDWTCSPYVASYFALESPAEYCAVWAIHDRFLREVGHSALKHKGIEKYQIRPFLLGSPDEFKDVDRYGCPGVFVVSPYLLHERLTIQQGLFVYPGDINRSFSENFAALLAFETSRENWEKHVVKIEIAGRGRLQALDNLNLMNINRATLFPGLDGFAQSIKCNMGTWFDPNHVANKILKADGYLKFEVKPDDSESAQTDK